MRPHRLVVVIASLINFLPLMAAVPTYQQTVDSQQPGSAPRAEIGNATPLPGTVLVDGSRAGFPDASNTIRFFRAGTLQSQMFCLPIGDFLSAGTRQLEWTFNYDSPGTNIGEQDSFSMRLLAGNLSSVVLDLRVIGINQTNVTLPLGELIVNGAAASPAIPVALGAPHTARLTVDATAKSCSVQIDSAPAIIVPWNVGVNDFGILEFTLNTPSQSGGSISGEAHLDGITVVDPIAVLQDWRNPVNGDWDDGANWTTDPVTPTSGVVLIRQSSLTSYTVMGPSGGIGIDALVISNTGGGTAELSLKAPLTINGLTLTTGGRLTIPSGADLTARSSIALNGSVQLAGGSLKSDQNISNNSPDAIRGFGEIASQLLVNTNTGVIQPSGGAMKLIQGTLVNQGLVDCNGNRLELAAGVEMKLQDAGKVQLAGGTLRSLTKLEFPATSTFEGPGTLELSGILMNSLSTGNLNTSGLNITLVGATTMDALTEDVGLNGHSLNGLNNVIERLVVAQHQLTLDTSRDNDPARNGANQETALYVRNLDLTGILTDVVGGKVYYENLVGGTDIWPNYVTIFNTAPNGTIDQPNINRTILVGQSVDFNATAIDPDNSTGGMTFLWNFGAGSGLPDVTVEDPGLLTFLQPGSFDVTFTVTDGEGLADPTPAKVSISVVPAPVNAAPDATIDSPSSDITVVVGAGVACLSTYSDPDNTPGNPTFHWTFGAGSGVADRDVEDPGQVIFGAIGDFTITLTVTDPAGQVDPTPATRRVIVLPTAANEAPQGVIESPAVDVTIQVGGVVNFAASATDSDGNTDSITYLWTFGAGSGVPNSNAREPGVVAFNQTGIFTVTLTATDSAGLSDPTPATRTVTVVAAQNNVPPNGEIDTPVGDVQIFASETVSFSGSGVDSDNSPGGLTFLWTFGAGSDVPNSTVASTGAVVFPKAGEFIVTFTVIDGLGLPDPTPAIRRVVVFSSPADLPATPNTGCGVCGPISPAFSLTFLTGYVMLLVRRRARRTR